MSRPWMPLYVADYLADTGHLTGAEHGAYLLLIMHYWANSGLPIDDRRLAAIARMTPGQWKNSKAIIADFFEPGWKHLRIEFELTEAARISDAGQAGGLASGRARRARLTNDRSTTDERSEQRSLNEVVNDLPTKREAPQLQSQEDKKEPSLRSGRTQASRGTRLPDDWKPSDDDCRFAADAIGLPRAIKETSKFKDYWRARAGPGGVKLDWSATWRNWIRRATEDTKPNGNTRKDQWADAIDRLGIAAEQGGISEGGGTVIALLPGNGSG